MEFQLPAGSCPSEANYSCLSLGICGIPPREPWEHLQFSQHSPNPDPDPKSSSGITQNPHPKELSPSSAHSQLSCSFPEPDFPSSSPIPFIRNLWFSTGFLYLAASPGKPHFYGCWIPPFSLWLLQADFSPLFCVCIPILELSTGSCPSFIPTHPSQKFLINRPGLKGRGFSGIGSSLAPAAVWLQEKSGKRDQFTAC